MLLQTSVCTAVGWHHVAIGWAEILLTLALKQHLKNEVHVFKAVQHIHYDSLLPAPLAFSGITLSLCGLYVQKFPS